MTRPAWPNYRAPRQALAWMDDAACRGLGATEAWDTESGNPVEAFRICGTCPVTAECRAHGEAMRATGIWGGVLLVDGEQKEKRRGGQRVDRWAEVGTRATREGARPRPDRGHARGGPA